MLIDLEEFLDSVSKQLNDKATELSKHNSAHRDAVLQCSKAFGAAAKRELSKLPKVGA